MRFLPDIATPTERFFSRLQDSLPLILGIVAVVAVITVVLIVLLKKKKGGK